MLIVLFFGSLFPGHHFDIHASDIKIYTHGATLFIFLDTETTGAETKDRLCQLAYKLETGEIVNELFKPPLPIEIGAMCVHHITNETVENKPSFKDSPEYHKLVDLLDDDKNIFVAHNAKFDVDMLIKEGINPKRVICTLKLARSLDPEGKIPRYSLQYLRYFLGIKIEATAHDALGDILVLEKLFERLFARMSKDMGPAAVENKMMDISSKPVLLSRMYFGKHKGQLFRDIPKDYLKWLSGTDLEQDMRYTVEWYLN